MTTPAPRLVIRDTDGSERTVELRDGVMRIGRSADNEIVLGDASKGVSRAHAELHIENGRCTIVDLHSQNGTWLNAMRVQRAEVRPDCEIAMGLYRMRLQTGSVTAPPEAPRTSQPVAAPSTPTDAASAEAALSSGAPPPAKPAPPAAGPRPAVTRPIADLPLAYPEAMTSPVPMPAIAAPVRRTGPAPGARKKPSNAPLIAGAIVAVLVVAFVAGLVVYRSITPAAPPPAAVAVAPPPSTPPVAPAAAPPPVPAPAAAPSDAPPAASRPVTPPSATPRTGSSGSGTRPGSAASRAAEAARTAANELPVPRKPGESLQEWQQRGQALQARYAFAKVALDRGDYAAAAGGFAAILLEEPGFLDAPQLLVKAREGLRRAAADALESGNKLDAAGDWMNALKKYDQAREIDRTIPGLEEAIKRVRDKMRTAGAAALRRARQLEQSGRLSEALTEYEKAAQWLPGDDPDHDAAKARAEQLRARLK